MDHKSNAVTSVLGLLIFATLATWGVYAMVRPATPGEQYDALIAQRAEAARNAAEAVEAAQLRAEGAARLAVLSTLRDPGSAQFSGVKPGRGAPGTSVCGLVNARNWFGGYAGAQRFIATHARLVIDGANTPAEVDLAWRETCL